MLHISLKQICLRIAAKNSFQLDLFRQFIAVNSWIIMFDTYHEIPAVMYDGWGHLVIDYYFIIG